MSKPATGMRIDDSLGLLYDLVIEGFTTFDARITELEKHAQKSGSKTGRVLQEPNKASKKRKRPASKKNTRTRE